MCGRAIVEHVLAVVGNDEATWCLAWNPHVNPAVIEQLTPHRLAHAPHKELMFMQLHRSPRHDERCYATPRVGVMKHGLQR